MYMPTTGNLPKPLGFSISEEKRTDDQFRTSYGVGHHWRPGYWFPDYSDDNSPFYRKLPPIYDCPENQVPNSYQTNYEVSYNNKFPNPTADPYGNDYGIHGKPQPHWKVNYVKDFVEKLNASNFRRPLTFGNRVTETQEKFKTPEKPKSASIDYLAAYKKLGEQKEPNRSKALAGDGMNFFVRDGDVFNVNNPYITTSNQTHRAFGPDEYDFARNSKVFSAPPSRNEEPMRDKVEFPAETKIGPVRHVPRSVPHSGLTTEFRANMKWPTHPRMRENYYSDVDCHCKLPSGEADQSSFLAPATYATEYQNIGSRRVAVV